MNRKQSPKLLLTAFFLGTLAVIQAFSFDVPELSDPETSPERLKLLDLLYRIDDYIERPENTRDSQDQSRTSQYSNKELSKKNDMGVLPPWNEFCRMMRITNCFHSQH